MPNNSHFIVGSLGTGLPSAGLIMRSGKSVTHEISYCDDSTLLLVGMGMLMCMSIALVAYAMWNRHPQPPLQSIEHVKVEVKPNNISLSLETFQEKIIPYYPSTSESALPKPLVFPTLEEMPLDYRYNIVIPEGIERQCALLDPSSRTQDLEIHNENKCSSITSTLVNKSEDKETPSPSIEDVTSVVQQLPALRRPSHFGQ